ncbi:MAG: NAD(P)/FAD-dependent oxidoreductase [Lachnospiraceae bacterium]|nr:NAD(P)/FAD-dependent oxidoreductase [Lachnospiraceae bacterium]
MRYDIAIVGTGPAGISAALTAKSRNKSILLIGSEKGSEKIAKTHMIVNYPGLPDVTGPELNRRLLDQVKAAGIPITEKRVAGIYAMGDYFSLQADQDFLEASSVILTTGTSFGKPLPGENENLGRGVSYCATCDAPLYKGKEVIVVGWNPKEESEAAFLSETCSKVTYLPMYRSEVSLPESVHLLWAKPVSVGKADRRMRLQLTDSPYRPEGASLRAGEGSRLQAGALPDHLEADCIFLLRESVAPDKLVPGLFAAGDLTGLPYQIAKAAGEGNVAAISAAAYLDQNVRKQRMLEST